MTSIFVPLHTSCENVSEAWPFHGLDAGQLVGAALQDLHPFRGGGLPALVPAQPGPRRAHEVTDDVLYFAEALLAGDTSRRAELVKPLADRFACACTRARLSRPWRGAGAGSAGLNLALPRPSRRSALLGTRIRPHIRWRWWRCRPLRGCGGVRGLAVAVG